MPSSTHDRSTTDGDAVGPALLDGPLAVAGFWTGVALPFLYVPLLVAGPGGPAQHRVAYLLIALHAVALVVGHGHRQGEGT